MRRVLAAKLPASVAAALVLLATLPLPAIFAMASPGVATVTPADQVFPQFGATPGHSFAPDVAGRGYNDSLVKWKLPIALSSASTTVANFSSDVSLNNTTGQPDVLGVVLGHPNVLIPGTSLVTIAAGNNGTTMWTYPILGNLFATPVAADLNLDGRMDLVIRSDNGLIEAVTPNITWDGSSFSFPLANFTEVQAQQLWNRSLVGESSTNNNLSTPIAVNTVGGAAPEILAPAGDRLFYLNGADGAEIRNQTVDGTIVSAPTAFERGGGWIILVASTNRTTANFSTVASDFIVTAFDTSLNFLWNLSYAQSYSTTAAYKSLDLQLPSPAAGNLDGAGPLDDWALVTPYENSLAQLRIFYNGSNSFAANATLQGLTGSAPAVVDLDGDGRGEVVALSYEAGTPITSPNSRVFLEVFAGNGTRLWNATIDEVPGAPRENVLAPPAVADFNGDGVRDIALFLTDGASEVRSGGNGSRILRHQVFDQASPTEFTGPAVADLDFDGFLDITGNAAAVSYALADLQINASEISVNNTIPEQFENVSVTATVRNGGNANARNVSVEFFDGAQKLNGSTLALILPGTNALANVVVNFSSGGTRTLTVVVDGNDTVDELVESNNTASILVNVTSLFGFRLESPLNRTVVQAGFSYAFVVNAVSEGTQANLVNLSHSGVPSGWSASLSPTNLTVTAAGTPGDTNTSFLTVNTAPLAQPGEYDIVVSGLSAYSSRNSADLTFTVIIGGQYGVAVYPPAMAKNVTAGSTVTYAFDVYNAGNSPDTLRITNSTPAPGWLVVLTRDNLSLPAGASAKVSAIVRAPVSALSGENDTVTVRAVSQNDSSRDDTVVLTTTVVVPDLVVSAIRFFRECGGESAGGAPRLVEGDLSQILIEVANAAQNAEISGVHLRVWIDGALQPDYQTEIGATGTGILTLDYNWTVAGVKVVTVEADPTNSIGEVSETNNDLSAQVTVKDTVPVGDLTVSGTVLKGGQGVAGAAVTLLDPRSGTTVNATAGGGGQFALVLLAAGYADGDTLVLAGSDGLDVGNATACAYSEDGQVAVDISLQLPSAYDFLLSADGPLDQSGAPGAAVTYAFDLTNRGSLNNTVLLSASGPWPTRVLDANGSSVSLVTLAPNGTAALRVEVSVPAGSTAGANATTALNATALGDTTRVRSANLTTRAAVLRQFGLVMDASSTTALAGTNLTLNLTVQNLGNADENLTLRATCQGPSVCTGWVVLGSAAFSIAQGGSTLVAVTLRTVASAVGGLYTVLFVAESASDPSAFANATFVLTVLEKRLEFSVTGASTLRLVPGESRSTNLTILNRGTVPDTFTVSTSPAGSGFTLALLPGGGTTIALEILPGESATVTVSVTAPKEVNLESFTIDILVESVGDGDQQLVSLTALIGTIYDFRITGPVFSETPEVGKEVTIYATVSNVGSRAFTGALQVRLTVAGELLGTQTVTNLAVGREETVAFRWTARVAGAIEFTLDVNMEAGSDIYESSFANNVATRSTTVEPQRAGSFLSSTGVLLMLVALVAVLLAAAAVTRRKDETKTLEDHEKAKDESDERRRGKGPGGLERL